LTVVGFVVGRDDMVTLLWLIQANRRRTAWRQVMIMSHSLCSCNIVVWCFCWCRLTLHSKFVSNVVASRTDC